MSSTCAQKRGSSSEKAQARLGPSRNGLSHVEEGFQVENPVECSHSCQQPQTAALLPPLSAVVLERRQFRAVDLYVQPLPVALLEEVPKGSAVLLLVPPGGNKIAKKKITAKKTKTKQKRGEEGGRGRGRRGGRGGGGRGTLFSVKRGCRRFVLVLVSCCCCTSRCIFDVYSPPPLVLHPLRQTQ